MDRQEMLDKTIAMRTGMLKMKRDREYWTEEERELLRTRFLEGVPVNEIAMELERAETALYQQIKQMQLYVKATRAPADAVPPPGPRSAYVTSAPLTGPSVRAADIATKYRRWNDV